MSDQPQDLEARLKAEVEQLRHREAELTKELRSVRKKVQKRRGEASSAEGIHPHRKSK